MRRFKKKKKTNTFFLLPQKSYFVTYDNLYSKWSEAILVYRRKKKKTFNLDFNTY